MMWIDLLVYGAGYASRSAREKNFGLAMHEIVKPFHI